MPATSRSGVCLRRRSAERPQRLALEVDDRPVLAIANRQRLAEMEVAVVAQLDDADEPAEPGARRPASARPPAAVRPARRRRPRAGAERSPSTRVTSSRRDGLGRHLGPRGAGGGERAVQLRGDPRPDARARRARRRRRRGDRAGNCQPSRASLTSSCAIATAHTPWASWYSRLPHSRGVWRKSVRSVRNRVISTSGLTPGCRRRKCLRIRTSPNTTEVLLCSPLSRRGATAPAESRRETPGSAPPAAHRSPRQLGRRWRSAPSSAWQNVGSSSASAAAAAVAQRHRVACAAAIVERDAGSATACQGRAGCRPRR